MTCTHFNLYPYMNRSLKITTYNARGLNLSIPYIRLLVKEFDVVCLSEHWLHKNRQSKLDELGVDIDFCARSSRFSDSDNYGVQRGQGGVAIIWKKSLGGVSEYKDVVNDRICGIRIQNARGAIFNIFSVYMPSMGSPECFETTLDDLAAIIDSMEVGSHSFVCGDLNADMGNLGGNRKLCNPTKRGKILYDFVKSYNLCATNQMPNAVGPVDTFYGPNGSSMIDYILIPSEMCSLVELSGVGSYDPLNCSDHAPVYAHLKIHAMECNYNNRPVTSRKKWDKLSPSDIFEKYTLPVSYRLREVEHLLINTITCDTDLDRAIEMIISILTEASSAIPSTRYRKHLKPYWTPELGRLKKEKVSCYGAWCSEGRPRDENSTSWKNHKLAKKCFARELKRMGKNYDNEQLQNVMSSIGLDHKYFWRALKRSRSTHSSKSLAIRNDKERVVHDLDEVLEVWRSHFAKLCTPKNDPNFDKEHYNMVNSEVSNLRDSSDVDNFLKDPFTIEEVKCALKKLHKRKAPGVDGISTEHVIYAGEALVHILVVLFNLIIEREYVPENLRRGIQVPLFKGKNLCSLDVNNYRGITLLTTLNKIFEILLWNRIEGWWNSSRVISGLQGACKKGQSCVHIAMLLQETVSRALETNRNVFVSYFDVSKAFDTVWTDGLFYKLSKMGISGKTWRILYKGYIDFKCKVRVDNKLSDWYVMQCGIHQGGFLSLMKYTAFIDSLLQDLEKSQLCCTVCNIPSSPAGYADDLAAVTISKGRTDAVHKMVYEYGMKWRFSFNAKKSAVLVYGETKKSHDRNSQHRVFKLGPEKVPEKHEYDHVGVKACIFESNSRVEEKVSKARRTLNASSGLGVKKNGLSMQACCIIFWSVVVPVLTFGAEIWFLSDDDMEKILKFQIFAGRRVQRFPHRTPRFCSFYGLGWIRLTTYIMIKKLLFVLSIITLENDNVIRKVFCNSFESFILNTEICRRNAYRSPVYELCKTCEKFGVLNIVTSMLRGDTPILSKKVWSKLIWDKGWELDDNYWCVINFMNKETDLLSSTMMGARYNVWWQLSDKDHSAIKICECIAKIMCHTSLLKVDDYRLKDQTPSSRMCEMCDSYRYENIQHLLMQCPGMDREHIEMHEHLYQEVPEIKQIFADDPGNVFLWLIGRDVPNLSDNGLMKFRCIAGEWIYKIYHKAILSRSGIG